MDNTVIITSKKSLLEYLSGLPDECVVIQPAWSFWGSIRAATKKHPNLSMDVRMFLPEDAFQTPDDIRGLKHLGFVPILFAKPDIAKEYLTSHALELRDKSLAQQTLPNSATDKHGEHGNIKRRVKYG